MANDHPTVNANLHVNDALASASNPLPVSLQASASIDIGDVTLLAGTALVGKVGIDQTTPGTTNAVSVPALASGGYSFLNIAAGQATTVVKASAGTLHTISLNSAATATNVTTVYDNATGVGTVIAIPNVVAATVPTTLLFDLAFANGLTIITATANGGNMTVTYK